jgi:hypothetical protein
LVALVQLGCLLGSSPLTRKLSVSLCVFVRRFIQQIKTLFYLGTPLIVPISWNNQRCRYVSNRKEVCVRAVDPAATFPRSRAPCFHPTPSSLTTHEVHVLAVDSAHARLFHRLARLLKRPPLYDLDPTTSPPSTEFVIAYTSSLTGFQQPNFCYVLPEIYPLIELLFHQCRVPGFPIS